jgi:TPR repeat protein
VAQQDFKKAVERASVCEHPNAVWLTKLFAACDVDSREGARQVFLGFENDPRALCFAAVLGGDDDEIRRDAELGDAFAQAWMARQAVSEECFWWAEKSAAQGERDGFFVLGDCCRRGTGCEQDAERAKKNYLVAAELRHVYAMIEFGRRRSATIWLVRKGCCKWRV